MIQCANCGSPARPDAYCPRCHEVPVMDQDKETLLINATRYCLGRQSYVVGEHCDILRRCWPSLRESVQEIIEIDVEMALDEGRVGMDQDRREWERVAQLWREA